MSINPHPNSTAAVPPESQEIRRDVMTLDLILSEEPELYVNIVGEPFIGLPIAASTERAPWLLKSERVQAEVAGFIWEKLRIVLYTHEVSRILRVLESCAWKDQRVDIELKDAIDHDPLLESLFILLSDPNSKGGVNLTASELLNLLQKKARLHSLDTAHDCWPKGPAQLSRRIGDLSPLLEKNGVKVERGRNPGGIRFINLCRESNCDDGGPVASQPPSIDKSHHPQPLLPADAADADVDGIYNEILPDRERYQT